MANARTDLIFICLLVLTVRAGAGLLRLFSPDLPVRRIGVPFPISVPVK